LIYNIVMKIINYENKDYIFKILKSQLSADLRRYKNEVYYVATQNSIICGISRYSILTEEDLARPDFDIFDIDKNVVTKNNPVNYLSGVWVNERYRGKGVGTSLLDSRMEHIKNNGIIITDVRLTSSLADIYKDKYHMQELQKTDSYYILKK